MKVAALDLGTNTFLCLIADVESGAVSKIYADEVRVVRLGQDVNQTHRFHPEALIRARQALTEFAELIKTHQPQKVLAMATSAARDVSNAEELFMIGRELKIPIQIIPGEREAEITYAGAVSGSADSRRRLVIDVGGGSTELIVGTGSRLVAGESLNLGCVRLTEQFQLRTPVGDEKIEQVRAWIQNEMQPTLANLKSKIGDSLEEVLAVAGTPTELARVEIGAFIPEKIDGFLLTQSKLKNWIQIFKTHTKDEIIQKFSVHPGRADVILIGALLLLECLRATSMDAMKVSTRGVRYGVALEMVRQ